MTPVDCDVTVVVPALQSARWIGATLAAIRAQSVPPREIIVVDNGSTDATARIASAGGATVLVRPGGGPSRARNVAIGVARTEWIAFCDADDLWEPDKLRRHCDAAALCPDAVMTISDWQAFDESGVLAQPAMCDTRGYALVRKVPVAPAIVRLDPESIARGMFETIFVLTSAAVVRRRALLDAGLFDEALAVAEDNDLFLRIITQGPVAAIEERLVRYRRHAASISRDEVANNASHRLLWQRIAQNPGRYPPGALEFVRRERVRRSRIAGEFAARRGRFGDARRELADSLHAGFSARAAVWYAASAACEIALRGRSRAAIIRGAPFQ